jgi:hypothetical protein
MLSLIFKLLLFVLLFLSVVVPNSLQPATAAVLVAAFLLSMNFFNPLKRIPLLIKLFACSVIVTIVYILIGQIRLAPIEAAYQTLVIYVASPLLWLGVTGAMLTKIDEETLIRWFTWLTMLAMASVGLYYYLFLTGGSGAVTFFRENANLNVNDGYAGATMSVYGSLIFISAGFFAASTVVKSTLIRAALLVGLTVAAITSGRSALILSIPVGLFIGTFFKPRLAEEVRRGSIGRRLLHSPAAYLVFSSIVCIFIASAIGRDLSFILGHFVDEVNEGGGTERTSQMFALLQGIVDHLGVGAGHGIGVSVIRSDDFPWRYETVWFATAYRVGIIGALIYVLPFLLYMKNYLYLRKKRVLGSFDLFMFAGFVAAFMASNTNPYIEAFSFQWMFIIPMVSIALKKRQYTLDVAEGRIVV